MSFGTVDDGKRVKPVFNPLAWDSDHRKRRRNRTTLSCINCHTSKRKCDRKRPACARCAQLGLTGLCVYEVEDPTRISDTQDETQRLLRRVAELETVVRELKNRPGPRRSQNNSTGSTYAWQPHPHFHSPSLGKDPLAEASTSTPSSTSASVPSTPTLSYTHHTHPRLHSQDYPNTPQRLDTDYHTHHTHHAQPPLLNFLPYPFSYPSLNTSPPPLPLPLPLPNHHHDPTYTTNPDIDPDPNRLIPQKPELPPEDEPMPCFPTPSPSPSPRPHNENSHTEINHCGCLDDPTTHTSIRDLSVHLQTTMGVLGRHRYSCMGMCVLRERVAELDRVVLNALATATTTNTGDRTSLGPRSPTTTTTSTGFSPSVGVGEDDDRNLVSASASASISEHEQHTSPIQDAEQSRY